MARDLNTVMTRDEAIDIFDNHILPLVQQGMESDGEPDIPARSEAWNNWTDAMCKDGQISDWQYENWTHPPSCGD
tara:strand:+ start:373 stop:597 length:225 start_codon:yes stop_codon:yes gene_type:complete